MKRFFFLILLVLAGNLFAQESEVRTALKTIERGYLDDAKLIFQDIKVKYPNHPSVLYLEGALTEDGEKALAIYTEVYEKYPASKYADAALYGMFSYYYSLGYYKKAKELKAKLTEEYPGSIYLETVNFDIPEEEIAAATTPPADTEKINTINYNFTIQAGAFLNSDNANRLKDQFIKDGYPSEIGVKEVGGGILNVVTVGLFVKEEETKELLDYLEKNYQLKGRVIPIKK